MGSVLGAGQRHVVAGEGGTDSGAEKWSDRGIAQRELALRDNQARAELLEVPALALSRLKSPVKAAYFRQHVDKPATLNECMESVPRVSSGYRLLLFIDPFEGLFTQVSKD